MTRLLFYYDKNRYFLCTTKHNISGDIVARFVFRFYVPIAARAASIYSTVIGNSKNVVIGVKV